MLTGVLFLDGKIAFWRARAVSSSISLSDDSSCWRRTDFARFTAAIASDDLVAAAAVPLRPDYSFFARQKVHKVFQLFFFRCRFAAAPETRALFTYI